MSVLKRLILTLIGLSIFWGFFSVAQTPATPPTVSASAQPTSSPLAEIPDLEKIRADLKGIQEEQLLLKERISDSQAELKGEEKKAKAFLEIEEVSPEEFQPILQQWRIRLQSHQDVLQSVQEEIEEVQQTRVRLQSRLKLLKLKEEGLGSENLALLPETRSSEIKATLFSMRQSLKLYENLVVQVEEVSILLGKNKSQLASLLQIYEKNYSLLANRWQQIRFSRFRLRQQPKFSWETVHLIRQEIDSRLRDYKSMFAGLKTYSKEIVRALRQKPLYSFFLGLGMGALFLLLRWIPKGVSFLESRSSHFTLLENFLQRSLKFLMEKSMFLFPLLGFALLLAIFPEARTRFGVYLFLVLAGLSLFWISLEEFKILFFEKPGTPPLLSLPPSTARSFYRHLKALLGVICLFNFLNFAETLLEYESEVSRLVQWILKIVIFGLILSLGRQKLLGKLFKRVSRSWIQTLFKALKLALWVILILIIGLDGLGYTYFSDYLVDGTLKSLWILPFLLFLRKGLSELIEYRLFTRGLTRFKVNFGLLSQWKKTLHLWTKLGFWAIFVFWISWIWDFNPELRALLKRILDFGFPLNKVSLTLRLVVHLFLIFYFSVLFSRFLQALLERNLYPRREWDSGIKHAISRGVHYSIILVALLSALRFLGFDVQNITVIAGALGVGLGFGLQNLANNFVSGVVLLIERPVKVGDVVQVRELTGKIKKIGARATLIETWDQATILIPNGEFLSSQVTNWTYDNAKIGTALDLGVAYGTDLEKAKAIVMQIVQAHPKIAKDPPPRMDIKGFGDSAVQLTLRIWSNLDDRGDIQNQILSQIEKEWRESGIEIPYPHRELILRKVHSPSWYSDPSDGNRSEYKQQFPSEEREG